MTLQEFAKLKVGDKIVCLATSMQHGEVVEVITSGIKLRWGPEPTAPSFTYTAQSTAWMQWDLVEPE